MKNVGTSQGWLQPAGGLVLSGSLYEDSKQVPSKLNNNMFISPGPVTTYMIYPTQPYYCSNTC